MRRVAPRGWEPIVSVYRDFWRVVASSVRPTAGARLALLALCGAGLVGGAGLALAQGLSDRDIRCMQLQQDLAAARGGGGNREDVARIDQQIAQADRVFQGTRAAMEDAGCFESFFIFGRGLVRSPKCLNMNDRVEDARRQLTQLQQQRQALTGGGGNRRRQAELQDALARSGCGGQPPAQKRRGGGLFDFFGGGQEEQEDVQQTPVYRSIDPERPVSLRLRAAVRRLLLSDPLLDLRQPARAGSAIVPVELRGAGRALCVSEPGPRDRAGRVAERLGLYGPPRRAAFQKEYVKGCSCKQAEYNPTEIEAANKRAEADAAAPVKGKGKPTAKAPVPPPAPQAAAPAGATGAQPNLDLDVTGSNPPAAAASPPSVPAAQKPPAPAAAAAPPPAAPPASASAAPSPQGQSTVIKKAAKPPVAQPAQ